MSTHAHARLRVIYQASNMEGGSKESLSCELCKVHPTSYEDLQAHLRGHAHLVMVQRSEVAERSLYIRGFSNVPSAKDDLYGVMSQFGGVVSVAVVSSDSAVYALVEFATVDSALSALRHSPPLSLHGHTLTIKPRILKTDKIPKRAVLQRRKKCLDVAGGAGVMESVGEEEGKKETPKKSKKQKRKERDETVGGIRLNEQAAAALSEAHSIELQLETLASHCRLGNTTAEDQLSLAWQLQAKFHRLLPSCVVVPFGAPFSGHGTVSSDCDLSLLSNPSPLELSLFIGPTYLPSHLHSAWDRLQTTRPMPAVEGESQQAGEVGMKEILAVLLADPSYSAVWAVPSARVPIIQFMSGQLHCDLSLNNRLGPANTRLLGAYMNFDPRMAVLVPCVRLWVRGWSLGRRLLNNYAMSLMLIQCLQHTTPPVLPCLQEPGVWPRNMAWIGSRGLSVEQPISLGGCDCSFTDPRSLLPSSNTAIPAQLLLHFFKYFSEEFSFSEHVVAIHTTSPLPIPRKESIPEFRVSSLCVQDPFERVHNVTKNMTSTHHARLGQALSCSKQLLAELLQHEQSDPSNRQDTIPLFKPKLKLIPMVSTVDPSKQQSVSHEMRPSVHKPLPSKNAMHSLQVDLETLARLLHDTPFASLEGRLEELDLKNTFVSQRLDHVVLHSLAHHFQQDFGITHFLQPREVGGTTSVSIGSAAEDDLETPVTRERKRERSPEEGEEEDMEVEEEEGGFEVKRRRLEGEESAEQLLCRLTEGEALDCRAQCLAEEESWVGARRRKRHQLRDGDSSFSSPAPQTPSLPSSSMKPCLSFSLTVSSQHHPFTNRTSVIMQASDPKFKSAFELFFSVCKKKYFH